MPLLEHAAQSLMTHPAVTMLNTFKQKTAYEIGVRLVGSEMCIRDSLRDAQS